MPTESLDQLLANLKDPRYFIERFFSIVDKDRQKVPFKLNPVQAKYFDARSHYDLILKARKEGITSLIAAIWTHACLFIPNSRAVIVSHEDDATRRLFAKVRYYLDNMGVDSMKFKADLDQDSQKQLSFPGTNSSFWIGTAGSRSFGRGDDITHLLLSEVPHYQNQDLLDGVLEACTNQAWRVLESTANGMGEAFHKMWKESKDLNSGSQWKRHFYSWFDDPEYKKPLPEGVIPEWSRKEADMRRAYRLSLEQLYWYRLKLGSMVDKAKMPQEYPCNDREAFISSGRPVFNQERLSEYEDKCSKPEWLGFIEDDGSKVEWKDSSEGSLKVWKMPKQREKFLISADVAEGVKGGDFSVAKVYSRSSWECIATWRGHVNPGAFGKILCDMGYFFNNAVLIPELNNHGWATVERILQEKYPHLLQTKELWPEGTMEKFGFPTNEKTRGLILSALRNAIEERTFIDKDMVTIQEMQSMIYDEQGRADTQGDFDDCVLASAIGIYCLKFLTVDETYRPSEKDVSDRALVTSSVVRRDKLVTRAGYR